LENTEENCIFIITLFISIMVFTYGVFGYVGVFMEEKKLE
jgi:hypothetical protein